VNNGENTDACNDAAFCGRVARYLDGELDAGELTRLNAELLAEPAKQVAFIWICTVRAALIREGAANRIAGEIHANERSIPAAGHAAVSHAEAGAVHFSGIQPMDETMIMPAIRDDESGAEPDPVPEQFTITATSAGLGNDSGRRNRRRWLGWGVSAAVMMLASGVIWAVRPVRPQPAGGHRPVPAVSPEIAVAAPPAVVTAVAGWDVLQPGTRLNEGQSVDLGSGAAELKFGSGASVLVRGPARVRISSRNGLSLDSGSLYAHVPPQAIGFTVAAPGLRVLDHGTNFGVRTAPAGAATEVHVFDGLVDATALNAQGVEVGVATPVRAGQAVGRSPVATDLSVNAIPFSAATFDRNIGQIRIPVPVHGTGAGLEPGSPDPQWQIVAVSGDPSWIPRPAYVVMDPRIEYPADSGDAKWISTTPAMESSPAANYTYRTTVDLTGFDPTSVSVQGTMSADDGVTDVVVNGKSCPLPETIRNLSAGDWRRAPHDVTLANSVWVAARNQVDVIVLNAPPIGGGPNYTGLQFRWTITASLAVRR
jgi:hypothetical protein